MSLSSIPRPLRLLVAERDAGLCRYCGIRQFGQVAVFHVDHVLPRSKGGATTFDNLVLQCPHCSLHKSNKTSAVDPDTGMIAPLFHPLQQAWGEHFEAKNDGTCLGRTPCGRATAKALKMNDSIPKTARALQWSLRGDSA